MLVNPLFDKDQDEDNEKPVKKDAGYVLQHRKGRTLQPISKDLKASHYTPVRPAPAQGLPSKAWALDNPAAAKPRTGTSPAQTTPGAKPQNAAERDPQSSLAIKKAGADSDESQPPLGTTNEKTSNDAAIELIRSKVAALYAEEPEIKPAAAATQSLQPEPAPHASTDKPAASRQAVAKGAVKELRTVEPPSKHQRFMQELTTSGKSLAHIQTEWHNYYVSLPDDEKHEVWREFYQHNARQPSAYTQFVTQHAQSTTQDETETQRSRKRKKAGHHKASHGLLRTVNPSFLESSATEQDAAATEVSKVVVGEHLPQPDFAGRKERRTRSQIKRHILDKVNLSAGAQAKAKQHFQSLMFGLGTGVVVLLIALFGFFNEVIIAPFIQPSRHVSATPIIISADSVAPSDTSEVIIPKINVQIPVVYDLNTTAENAIQKGLEDGVVHYSTTTRPGELGNAAFFGHSSNNIFNKGKYKFAFVLLHELEPGDTFLLTYNKKIYTYKVFDKKIVPPSEVSVLNNVEGKSATATLITCDPPGTSTNRLVVWGEQINPDPSGATAPTTPTPADSATPTTLPSEGPTLLGRFWKWLWE